MLVLTRKTGEELVIGDNIKVVVNRISGNRVTLGISAPDEVRIVRGELQDVVESFDEESRGNSSQPVVPPVELNLDDRFSSRSAR